MLQLRTHILEDPTIKKIIKHWLSFLACLLIQMTQLELHMKYTGTFIEQFRRCKAGRLFIYGKVSPGYFVSVFEALGIQVKHFKK